MDTREAIVNRIRQLCKERGLTPNGISNISAVPQATVKSILNGESQNPGTVTIKKLCDGFEITLGEFFSTPEFDELEQEILDAYKLTSENENIILTDWTTLATVNVV